MSVDKILRRLLPALDSARCTLKSLRLLLQLDRLHQSVQRQLRLLLLRHLLRQ
jgi:hypothetical protein